MRVGCGCFVWLVVEGGEGEDCRGVGIGGVGVCDVLSCRGSAVGEEGWGTPGSQWGEDGGTVCAEVDGELTREIWGGVGCCSQFKGEVSPEGRGEEVGFEGAENTGWELYYSWVAGSCA